MSLIDIDAPIYPGKSIAGIPLGVNLKELREYIDNNSEDKSFLGSTSYNLLDGIVSIGVHDKSNKVFRISANVGYKGLLLDKYSIGMSINSLLSEDGWEFDESQGGVNSPSNPGVIACIELEDPDSEELSGQDIFEIAVFVDNIDNLDDTW